MEFLNQWSLTREQKGASMVFAARIVLGMESKSSQEIIWTNLENVAF